jgi:predicted negative regulator of RcsB-dependent stress response
MDTTTVETVASVEVQENMMPEISAIKAVSGGSPVVTILLAAIVMFGGPAAWKFWTARQKAKTELEERRLELEAKIELAKIKADSEDEKEVKKVRKTKKNTKGESSKEKP